MNDSVLIISRKDAFIVKSMQKQLTDAGYFAAYCPASVDLLSEYRDKISIFIYYMEDIHSVDEETLVYLKDFSVDEEKMVILIGAPDEFKEATKIIPEDSLAAWFNRPFDMRLFMEKIAELTNEKAMEHRKKSILLVDDDVAYLKMVHTWLKDHYRVSIASSGMQAITWLAKNHVDLVILDYSMPIADGPSILEMLRTESNTSSIPVFFLTSKRDRDAIQRAVDLHPDRYLLKTIGKEVLLAELDKFFVAQKTLKK